MTDVKTQTRSSFELWMITSSVMLVAVIEVLDMTIVNVALPHMMGALGATTDQITWVLTSYIVASAVCMPLTGFLVGRLGQKKLLLWNIVGFLIASMLCGASANLMQIVFFRILQGIFGATLVPLSQLILRETFPKEKQGQAMAIWGIGIMVAPIFGPTIGGYITDNANWRWIFYINFPVCVIAFFMALRFIKETPIVIKRIDWVGLFWMVLGIGSLQLFLDQGNQYNWLDSNFILVLLIFCIFSLAVFFVHAMHTKHAIVNIRLFADRNLAVCTFVLTVFCMAAFGVIAIQPIMMEQLFNYPVSTTGLAMAPRGLASAFSMMLVARFINQIDVRIILLIGLLSGAYGAYLMTQFSLDTDLYWIVVSSAIQGFGMGLIFVPLSSNSLMTLPQGSLAEGSGLFSFGRSLGGSIGISLIATVLSRQNQMNWNRLGGHLAEANPALVNWLAAKELELDNPLMAKLLGVELSRQAGMLSFINCYHLTMLMFLAMIPVIFLLKPARK